MLLQEQTSLFQNEARLIRALQFLNDHRDKIERFYHAILDVQVQGNGIEKLKGTFRASVNERRGASYERGRKAVEAFDDSVADISEKVNIAIATNPEEAHRILFESLVMLPEINQKIAAMFIKFLVVYLGEWTSMMPFLLVPIDRVVLKILGEKLKVYKGDWEQSPSVMNPSGKLYVRSNRMSAHYSRFIAFQNEVGEIARRANVARVFVDELWFIGYVFCKEYPLCGQCWVREVCEFRPNG